MHVSVNTEATASHTSASLMVASSVGERGKDSGAGLSRAGVEHCSYTVSVQLVWFCFPVFF